MRSSLLCYLVAWLIVGPACTKTAYIVPSRAPGVEVPDTEAIVIGRSSDPAVHGKFAIDQRCVHWDTARPVDASGREVRAEVSKGRKAKLITGGILAGVGLVPLAIGVPAIIGGVGMIREKDEIGGVVGVLLLMGGAVLTIVGAGVEGTGIGFLASGAADPCGAPELLPDAVTGTNP